MNDINTMIEMLRHQFNPAKRLAVLVADRLILSDTVLVAMLVALLS